MNTASVKDLLKQLEDVLAVEANKVVPEGSTTAAVVHQWAHALAYGTDLFSSATMSVKKLRTILSKNGLYKDQASFRRKLRKGITLRPKTEPAFTFIDLFAGIGGMRLGFQANGGNCVFSSEFEKNAQVTYLNNHGEKPFGDITEINEKSIPNHDVLIAGFPCQPFSHAGLKLGIDDIRGTLFHDITRILKEKKPSFALLENVKGLISNDRGHTLTVILKTLTKIGYSCNISKKLIENGSAKEIQHEAKKMVLKSIDFGVPQNRQRIYIVLWRDGLIEHFEYPKPTGVITRVGDILEEEPDPKLTISDRLWAGHQRRKIENKKNGKGFGFGLVSADSTYTNTISARYYKDGSEILIDQGVNMNPRKVSHREAARLQGFPEEFMPSQSNVQAYKQFGNSVSVSVIEALSKMISIHLKDMINE
jgi:DNA (cytosine-5)-methyltransferase 1